MGEELTIPALFEGVAAAMGGEPAFAQRHVRRTFAELAHRMHQAGNVLAAAGAGPERPRAGLHNWESGQGHVALLLRNGAEYVESMLGSFAARAVPFNVNFRYTAEELAEVFGAALPVVVVAHGEFAAGAGDALRRCGLDGHTRLFVVPDGTEEAAPPGSLSWPEAVAAALPSATRRDWSPDDLYMLFTGGTTGRPKGVLWRQADALVAAFGVTGRDDRSFDSVAAAVAAAQGRPHRRVVLPAPPFIHGASQWFAFGALLGGGRVVVQDDVVSLDPAALLDDAEREGVTEVLLVGDAFARPLAESLESRPRALPSLRAFVNGGAALSDGVRDRLLAAVPHARVVDSIGSSESGRQTSRQYRGPGDRQAMAPLSGTTVVSEDRRRVLAPGDREIGWLARSGRVPLGYLGDREKTEQTFPVIAGVRHAVPGDRARWLSDGTVDVLGRDATLINTGGEKVFGEEVEAALVSHWAVADAVVVGRPSPRWGQEVVALVALGAAVSTDVLLQHAAVRLARYKLPKRIVVADCVPRTIAGKADHRAVHALLAATEDRQAPTAEPRYSR